MNEPGKVALEWLPAPELVFFFGSSSLEACQLRLYIGAICLLV